MQLSQRQSSFETIPFFAKKYCISTPSTGEYAVFPNRKIPNIRRTWIRNISFTEITKSLSHLFFLRLNLPATPSLISRVEISFIKNITINLRNYMLRLCNETGILPSNSYILIFCDRFLGLFLYNRKLLVYILSPSEAVSDKILF